MTAQQATEAGFEVVAASAFEVGLVKRGRGVRTWWAKEFGGHLPGLEHPLIQQAIMAHEEMEREWQDLKARAKALAKT